MESGLHADNTLPYGSIGCVRFLGSGLDPLSAFLAPPAESILDKLHS